MAAKTAKFVLANIDFGLKSYISSFFCLKGVFVQNNSSDKNK
jgi:hypothetical protein